MSEKIELLGVRLEVFETEEALEKIKEFLKEDGLRIVGMVTSAMLLASEESEEFRQQLEQLNLCVIREREVLEAAGITKAERLWEAEENWFLPEFLEYLEKSGKNLVLIAETAEEKEQLSHELHSTYPQLEVAGCFCLKEAEGEEADALINQLNAISADVILAALPSPVQEDFAYRIRSKLNSRLWIGMGKNCSVQKGKKGRQKFLERLLEKRTFRKRVAEFSEENEINV